MASHHLLKINMLTASMLVATLSLTACGSDNDSSTTILPEIVDQQQTISGIITDTNGNPLADATVTIEDQTITTTNTGAYVANVSDSTTKTVALVKKTGYLTTAREIIVLPKQSYKLNIALSPDQVSTAFASSAGINELLVSGAKVSIPANSIVQADGSAYTGTVNIAANYYSPDSLAGARAFAQPFTGQDEDGSDRTDLVTVGVIDVKLTDPATGAKLDLKEDTDAILIYPEVSTDQGLSEIPLWYYDEEQTIWVKDGEATRQADGSYKGEVSHFTLWNLDIPVDEYYALLEGCIIDATTKQPYTKDDFIGQIIGRGFYNLGGADTKGKFSIKVPFNTPLTLLPVNYSAAFNKVVIPALAQDATYQINGGNCIEIGATNNDGEIDLNGNSFDELPVAPEIVTPNPAPPTFEPPTEENIIGLVGYNFDFDTDSDTVSGLENISFNTLSTKSNNTLEVVEKSLYEDQQYGNAEDVEIFSLTPQGISAQTILSVTDDQALKIKQLNTTFSNNRYTQRLDNGFVSTGTYTDVSLSGQKIGDVFAFENNDTEGMDYYNDIPTKVIETLNNLPNGLNTFNSSASCKKALTGSVNIDYIQLFSALPNLSFEQVVADFGNAGFKRGTWAGIPWIYEVPEADDNGIPDSDDDDAPLAYANYNNTVYAGTFYDKDYDALTDNEKDNCEFYNEAAKDQILAAIRTAYPTL